jgi:hypothetical protein
MEMVYCKDLLTVVLVKYVYVPLGKIAFPLTLLLEAVAENE